jgi:hypothetical protein
MASDKKVPTELAEQEFDRFLEAMDLAYKCDPSKMDAEDNKALDKHKLVIVTAIERGNLVIDEKGQPIFTPSTGGDPITFFEPEGASFMASDTVKSGKDVEKTNAVLGAMTQQPAKRFAQMKGRDYKVCQSIFILFLA